MTFDPFGDFATRGYLQNVAGEKNPEKSSVSNSTHSLRRCVTRCRLSVAAANFSMMKGWILGLVLALAAGPALAQSAGSPVDAELLFWQSMLSRTEKADYQAYLKSYPEGRFAALAKLRLAAAGAGGKPAAAAIKPTAPVASAAPERVPTGSFSDCTKCPTMVPIPAGAFTMGVPSGEEEQENIPEQFRGWSLPLHRVTIMRGFALGKYAVTVEEWDACVADGGCDAYVPDDHDWSRGRRPVTEVSWDDAQAYVAWLSKKTQHQYRLPSEAEWEYAARADTTTARYWGDEIGKGHANCDGCGSQWDGEQPAPVGSFAPNPFGLYDMLGNVWQWTADCWNGNYAGAPRDGSAWTTGECGRRVVRGGSWYDFPGLVRGGYRLWVFTGGRFTFFGFRVARTL